MKVKRIIVPAQTKVNLKTILIFITRFKRQSILIFPSKNYIPKATGTKRLKLFFTLFPLF